jgi:hybrid cluster-associated redox disulfide protein
MNKKATNGPAMPFSATTTVAELLRDWPETIPVFLRFNMACVGCGMAAFEHLADAAKIYNIPPEQFLERLNETISGK